MTLAPSTNEFDLAPLAAWMDAQDGRVETCGNMRRLQAGTQNLMILFERGGVRYVLRQPPVHAIYPPAKLVTREVRVLRALEGSEVPHPSVFSSSIDETLGSPFYVMSAADGFTPTEGLPPAIRQSPALQTRLAQSCIEALVALSRVDHVAVGLGDLGNPDGFLARQVSRWRQQLASYAQFESWQPEGALQRVEAVGNWLEANLPPARAPGLLHGDFHLGNVMFGAADAEVVSVIDWELATIGDPLVDLGWLIATWPLPDGTDNGAGIGVPGASALPSPQEIVSHYAAVSGEPITDVTWYVVLACFKLGIIQEGSWARAIAGKADRAIGALQHQRAQSLITKAEGLIREGGLVTMQQGQA